MREQGNWLTGAGCACLCTHSAHSKCTDSSSILGRWMRDKNVNFILQTFYSKNGQINEFLQLANIRKIFKQYIVLINTTKMCVLKMNMIIGLKKWSWKKLPIFASFEVLLSILKYLHQQHQLQSDPLTEMKKNMETITKELYCRTVLKAEICQLLTDFGCDLCLKVTLNILQKLSMHIHYLMAQFFIKFLPSDNVFCELPNSSSIPHPISNEEGVHCSHVYCYMHTKNPIVLNPSQEQAREGGGWVPT